MYGLHISDDSLLLQVEAEFKGAVRVLQMETKATILYSYMFK